MFLIIFLVRQSEIIFLEIPFIYLRNWQICFVLLLDQVSLLFIFRVSLIRFSVLIFSKSYIVNDKNFMRFHYLLISFILRIYFLILRPNIIRILLGWDGLGLRSYLLVIYYGSRKAYNSGIITALTNRLGDSLILIRVGYLFLLGNWNLYFYSLKSFDWPIVFLIILAACTKRAQIPFSAWLPAAIAAPTPVSALVHSSTLVTAGVYLLIRHERLFYFNNMIFYIILVGALTITIASLRALFETDLKKIVALSTLRQLGVIFLRLGIGRFLMRYFHLLTHAFFKALLFLCTGSIIHRRKDYQDLRLIGNSINSLPTVNRFILVSSFSLIGLPFISAFFSKEMILETIILQNFNFLIYLLIIIGIGLTAIYRSRFVMLVFANWNMNNLLTLKSEEDWFILKSIFVLLIPASLRGSWIYLYLFNSLKLSISRFFIKTMVLVFIILRIYWFLNTKTKKLNWNIYFWSIRRMWLLPFISSQRNIFLTLYSRNLTLKMADRGVLKFRPKIFNFFFQATSHTITLKFINKILFIIFIWIIVRFIFYLCKLHYIKAIIKNLKTKLYKIKFEILYLDLKKSITENSLIFKNTSKENPIIK